MAQYVEGQGTKSRGCFFYGCMTCLAIIVVVVVGLGALGFLGYRGQASTRETAAAYLDACDSGDYAHAYEMVTAAWSERTPAEQFAAAERAAASSRGPCEQRVGTGVSLQKQTGAGTRAEIGFDALCGGVETRITVTMVKEEGQWRVDGVDYRSRAQVVPLACPNCGAVSPAGTNFCPRCGQPLTPAEDPLQAPTDAGPADSGTP